MSDFLGSEAFLAPCDDVAAFSGSFVGQAEFNGCIAFCNWSREDVARVLPAELELAANASATPELHPLVFILGEQTAGATLFGGLTFPLGIAYREFALAVPFVRYRHGRHPHVFIARMFATFFPATWAGNAYYGLEKAIATILWHGTSYAISATDGTPLLHAVIEPTGEWEPATGCRLANFAGMRSVFALPVLGRRLDGTYVESHFGWDFGAAHVRPAGASVSIHARIVEGMAPRSCSSLGSATFEVRQMIWRLSWPAPLRV
ncbi:MAG TPA: hypothetical protein VMR29_10450 [Candidatus Binatia bacterium]|nr:hypothetical protein [Candidatus Binatia bacterium]